MINLGSIQYAPIAKIYAEYFEAAKKKPSNIYTRLYNLGIHFRMKALRPFEEATALLREDMIDPEMGIDFDSIDTAEGLFEYARDAGWDLWSAAPFIASAFFTELELDELDDAAPVEGADGWPIINQMIIGGESRVTAAACIILKEYGIIKDEGAFNDFST